MAWGFYGRSSELRQLEDILGRKRWFFARITGRRRIGKTTLVQQALQGALLGVDESSRPGPPRRVLYVQIPDSAPAGVLSAVHDAMDTFELPASQFPRPDSLLAFARTVEQLAEAGFVVALDEFQYFSRKHLAEFASHLQASVDALAARAARVTGGLIVLGSLHTELVALLEDRDAPLYNRVTDQLELQHLDIGSLLHLLDAHADRSPERLLFLWNLFEGVPKFYRDAFEQGVLDGDRKALLAGMFFRSSSPLRSEADHWFLSELRGRYDVVLKYVARQPGCTNADIEAHLHETSPLTAEHAGGYLKILTDRYRMLERRLPILATASARRGRFYLRDNFLRSWLAALASPVSAASFRPEVLLVDQADSRLAEAEGFGFERLVGQLYEERSRKGLGDFALTRRIDGYWDRSDTEIDLVALDEDSRTIRFGTCKRNAERLPGAVHTLADHAQRFLNVHRSYQSWRQELVAIAPTVAPALRKALEATGAIVQELETLTEGLA